MAVEMYGKDSNKVQVVAKNVTYLLQDNPDYSYVRNLAVQDIEKQYYDNQRDEQDEIQDMLDNGEIDSEDEYDKIYADKFDPDKYKKQIDDLANKYMLNVADLPKDVVVVMDKNLSENEDAIKAAIQDKLGTQVSQIEKYGVADKKDVVKQQAYEAIGDMYKSDDYRKYLDLTSNMNGYSLRNTALVISQYPDAEAVKGFKAWKEFDRGVAKGESGNAIFCPTMKSLTTEKQVDTYMKAHASDFGGQNSVKYDKERNRLLDKIEKDGKAEVLNGYFVSYVWDIKQTQCLAEKDNTEELLNALRFNKPLLNNLDNYDIIKDCIDKAMTLTGNGVTTYTNLSDQENLYKNIERYADEVFKICPEKITGIKSAEPSKDTVHKMETMMSAYLVSKHIGIECDEKMAFELGGVLKNRLSDDAIRYGRREMFTQAYERATKFSKDFNKAFDKEFAPFERSKEETKEITIKVEFSESNVFEDGKTYSVKEFDELMSKADTEKILRKKEGIAKYGDYDKWYEAYKADPENVPLETPYDKVKFTVQTPDGQSITERQDIGDGNGGVIDYLKQFVKYKNLAEEMYQQAYGEATKEDLAIFDITIKCNFSESDVFRSGQTYSVSNFDAIMRKADNAYVANKNYVAAKYGDYRAEQFLNRVESEAREAVQEKTQKGITTTFNDEMSAHKDYSEYRKILSGFGYDKVDFTVTFSNGDELRERQDIGDGHGGVIDFLSVCDMKKEALQLTEQALLELNAKIPNAKDMAAAEEMKQQREHLQQIKPVLKEDISQSKTKHKNDAQKE